MSLLIIGHRGLRDEYPENTIPAVNAAARDVDVVEIDIRRCGSGELVVVHDENLERLTGHDQNVSQTDLETLQSMSVQNSDDKIPSLVELLEKWPGGTGINMDMKGTNPTNIENALEHLQRAAVDEPWIISIDLEMLETVDPRSFDVPIGLSFWQNSTENIRRAVENGCEYVHVYYQLCLETDIVTRAHRADLSVDAWSIDDRGTSKRLEEADVDAVTVNSTDALL